MASVETTSFSLILIALGILGIILSFLVPDRKKSLISIILAALIIGMGVIHYFTQGHSRRTALKRFQQSRQLDRADMDKIRKEMREKFNKAKEASSSAPSVTQP